MREYCKKKWKKIKCEKAGENLKLKFILTNFFNFFKGVADSNGNK